MIDKKIWVYAGIITALISGFAFIAAKSLQFPNMQKQVQSEVKLVPKTLPVSGVSGKSLTLGDFEGKVVVLNFWATWCPPCIAEMPHFVALSNAYPKDVAVIGISVDEDAAVVRAFLTKNKISYPIGMMDPAYERVFGNMPGIPTTFVLDRQLRVVKRVIGYQSFSDMDAVIKPYL